MSHRSVPIIIVVVPIFKNCSYITLNKRINLIKDEFFFIDINKRKKGSLYFVKMEKCSQRKATFSLITLQLI